MLSVTIYIKSEERWKESLKSLGFQQKEEKYIYRSKNKELLSSEFIFKEGKSLFEFSPGLNLEEYTSIHLLLNSLVEMWTAEYDDSDSLLGYLKDGEGAYILTNWGKWHEFLQDAKLKSLEGKKVRVVESEQEIASGLYVDSQKAEGSSQIIECTIITLFGEKTYKGKDLQIESTNEW